MKLHMQLVQNAKQMHLNQKKKNILFLKNLTYYFQFLKFYHFYLIQNL